MSFILDTLRKSEHARQHLGGATLAELPLGRRPKGQPWWVFALGALLIVNLIVLSFVLFREAPTSQPVAASAPAAQSQIVRTAPPLNSPANAPAPLAEEAAPAATVQYETIPRSESPLAENPNQSAEEPTLVKRIDTPANSSGATQSAPVPNNPNGLPDLHIDMHAYAQAPKDRFVYINKRKYTEGQVMQEGPRIFEITADGVVLAYQGQQMRLQRP